jgi:hypothetical protein
MLYFCVPPRRTLTSHSKSLRIFALALTLAAIASGCGNSGDGGEAGAGAETGTAVSTSSISKEELTEQTNSICKPGKAQLLKEVLAYQKKHLNEASIKVVSDTARKVIKPALEAQVEKIRSLGAPPGGANEIESFLISLLGGVDEIITKKPLTFSAAEGMLRPASDIARRYGIDQCQYVLVDEQFNTRVLNSG